MTPKDSAARGVPSKILPRTAEELTNYWHRWANEYDERDREAMRRKEYEIAAQQAGLACAFRVCANDLETVLKVMEHDATRQL